MALEFCSLPGPATLPASAKSWFFLHKNALVGGIPTPSTPLKKHESVGMIILNKHQPDGGLTWKTWLWRLEDCFMSCCCRNKLWFHVGYSLRTWGCRPKTRPIIIPSVESFLVLLPIQSAILGYPWIPVVVVGQNHMDNVEHPNFCGQFYASTSSSSSKMVTNSVKQVVPG
jgi:hypothetical protein